MSKRFLHLTAALSWDEGGLPVPDWDLVGAWLAKDVPPDDRAEAWTDLARQWIEALGHALGSAYQSEESEHFLMLAGRRPGRPRGLLLPFAEKCRRALLEKLPDISRLDTPEKLAILAFADNGSYFSYISLFYPEGEHGASAGVQIREGYPHVALQGEDPVEMECVLAHELTHASLAHRALPQWIEEGLAQIFEHTMATGGAFLLTREGAEEHREYWREHGLSEFWSGEGFGSAGEAQRLSYELAELLMRRLLDDHRPRWFGIDRRPQERLIAFLRAADRVDAGDAAARECLAFSLERIAAEFLGPGDWSP